MSTRGTLQYLENKLIHFHIYHECIDETVRLDFKLFGLWICSATPLPKKWWGFK